jgi:hypothetical protein
MLLHVFAMFRRLPPDGSRLRRRRCEARVRAYRKAIFAAALPRSRRYFRHAARLLMLIFDITLICHCHYISIRRLITPSSPPPISFSRSSRHEHTITIFAEPLRWLPFLREVRFS